MGKHGGNFAAKHPEGTMPNKEISEALKEKAKEGRVSCAAAHKIAEKFNSTPAEIGMNMDLLGFRISKCQMGLFGYYPEKRIVKPLENVSAELEAAINSALKNKRLSCADSWKIAEKFGISRMEIANACETLKLKISPCQLGAF